MAQASICPQGPPGSHLHLLQDLQAQLLPPAGLAGGLLRRGLQEGRRAPGEAPGLPRLPGEGATRGAGPPPLWGSGRPRVLLPRSCPWTAPQSPCWASWRWAPSGGLRAPHAAQTCRTPRTRRTPPGPSTPCGRGSRRRASPGRCGLSRGAGVGTPPTFINLRINALAPSSPSSCEIGRASCRERVSSPV